MKAAFALALLVPRVWEEFPEFDGFALSDDDFRIKVLLADLIHELSACAARRNWSILRNRDYLPDDLLPVCDHRGYCTVFGAKTYAAPSIDANTKIDIPLVRDQRTSHSPDGISVSDLSRFDYRSRLLNELSVT